VIVVDASVLLVALADDADAGLTCGGEPMERLSALSA